MLQQPAGSICHRPDQVSEELADIDNFLGEAGKNALQLCFDFANELFKLSRANLGKCRFNRFEQCLSNAVLGRGS